MDVTNILDCCIWIAKV